MHCIPHVEVEEREPIIRARDDQLVPKDGRVLCPYRGVISIDVCYPCPDFRTITLNAAPSPRFVYCAEAKSLPFDRPASRPDGTDAAG